MADFFCNTTHGHGGALLAARKKLGAHASLLDFSANINPCGPPDWLRMTISREIDNLQHYPDASYGDCIAAIARYHGLPEQLIVVGNGSTELLYGLPRLLGCQRAVVPVPAYIDYARAAGLAGLPVTMFPLLADEDFQLDQARLASLLQPGDLVIIGRPNNPNGRLPEGDALLALAKAYPGCTFLIDEAFLEFAGSNLSLAGRAENILTLHSMTKFYAIPGLRLGYAVLTAELAERWQSQAAPWTVNHLAQAVGCRALADTSYQEQSRQRCRQLRTELSAALADFPQLQSFSASANYLLLRLARGTARELADKLLTAGILIRCCSNYPGLDERYFRVAVRTERENGLLLEALASALPPRTARKRTVSTRKTPAIMLQGTSSNAGKSVLTTALCRILLQDGVRVAPFKAQNMSLNSYVTRDGGEMGRAQVVQAQAARLDPDVRMNPVLLKPSSDVGCQIIVEGQPLQSMNVDQYALYKQLVWPKVTACYDSLSADYQAVVLEGAGSPGEVNLKQNDIVNMRMAAYAQAPVLLVGDIDRGGVYASFIGTMEVLDSWERQLLAGFIVNRFRGQADLLESAHQYVYRHTGKPVLGVVPYLPQLGLPEEDSVSFKAGLYDRAAPGQDHVRIAVLDLPHISNFTDIEPFLAEPDVHLLICRHPEEAAGADALILPGSKNVPADLRFLHDSGFAACIRQMAADGTEIVGICGGYQMLGRQILDPLHLESLADNACPGIALLDLNTELLAEKTLRLKKGLHLVANQPVSGYEIHHGVSVGNVREILRFEDGTTCGARHPLLPVWGSYLHGIFDSDPFRRWFIDGLRQRKGLTPIGQICAPYDLEAAFDRLAETVRKSLDMPRIYSLLRL